MNKAAYAVAFVCTGNPLLASFVAIGATVFIHRIKELFS